MHIRDNFSPKLIAIVIMKSHDYDILSSEDEMRDSNLIGPIIGGALGSLCLLLLLLLLAVTMILVKILTYRKSEDKTTHIRQGMLVPLYSCMCSLRPSVAHNTIL